MGVATPEPPLQNSNTSDYGEIWTMQVNLPEKNYGRRFISLAGPVGELWGAEPPNKIRGIPVSYTHLTLPTKA